MQAIVTKYLGPTNFRGSRVSAQAEAGRIVIGWNDALNSDDNHRQAALALCNKLGWQDILKRHDLHEGGLPNNTGSVFVFVRKEGR